MATKMQKLLDELSEKDRKALAELLGPSMDVGELSTLEAIIASAKDHDERCSAAMDSSNVFATTYRRLAESAQKLVGLINDRGHNGGR